MATDEYADTEVFDGEPGDGQAGLDRCLAESLGKVALTGAENAYSSEARALAAEGVRRTWGAVTVPTGVAPAPCPRACHASAFPR